MSNLEANLRSDITKGKNNILRKQGMVPGIVYGGQDENELISVSKKHLKILLDQENFLSNVLKIKINDKGAETPKTLMIVIINTGNPFPIPCNTRPVVIPTAIKGYTNANNLRNVTATFIISESDVKNPITFDANI